MKKRIILALIICIAGYALIVYTANNSVNQISDTNELWEVDFIDNFEVSEAMVYAFQEYLNIRTESNITFVAYHEEVKQYIKATLADQLYGIGAFEEVYNKHDIMIEEVLKLSMK